MHEFVVRGVESVLHRALEVGADLEYHYVVRAPAVGVEHFDVIQRRPLALRQIAEKSKQDAVFLLRRI
jgi:hypothetical protein